MISRYLYITALVCLIVVTACETPSNPSYGPGNPDPNPPDKAAAIITSISPDSSLPFEKVVINGSGFNTEPSANLVSFGPHAAMVTAAAANQLEVIVPPAAGFVSLKVAVNGAVDWSNQVPFKFISFFRDIDANEVTTIDEEILWPMGVAVDDAGNVYVGSADEGVVYKITPEGVKSAFASVPVVGNIHFGADNYLYVCERDEGKIVKISSDGSTIEDVVEVEGAIDFDWDADGNMYIAAHDYGVFILPPGGSVSEVAGEIGSVKNCRIFGDYLYVSKIWDGVITRFDISDGFGEEEDYLEDADVPIAFDFDLNGVMYWGHAWTGSINVYAPSGAEETTIYEEEIPAQNRWMTYHNQDIYLVNSSNGPGEAGTVFKVHIGVDQAPRY